MYDGYSSSTSQKNQWLFAIKPVGMSNMPEYLDITVISEKRDVITALKFINNFLPTREESADEYEIPQFADSPTFLFTNALDVIKYCCKNKNMEYPIYWHGTNQLKSTHAIIRYLKDESVIYGLSINAKKRKLGEVLLIKSKKFLNSKLGYIGHEASSDPVNLDEFKHAILEHKI